MTTPNNALPASTSSSLALRHPTAEENTQIWKSTASMWADTLLSALYLEEQAHLATVPLARNGGMTAWILIDTDVPSAQRQILSSCETYRKRALVTRAYGEVEEGVVHGVASVFCPDEFRGRGYAGRMLKELTKELRVWQTNGMPCIGSILYSDIGRQFYGRLGWQANTTNTHVELKPEPGSRPTTSTPIDTSRLLELCKSDEALLQKAMAAPSPDNELRMTIIPDVEHMLWHHAKEEYTCEFLFGKIPHAKGAMAGSSGSQVHAIWTHRYYDRLDADQPHNVLYILRLVIEADPTATRLSSDVHKRPDEQVYRQTLESFTAVLLAAQAEAADWNLDGVQIWDPAPMAKELLHDSGLHHVEVERESEHIASLLWYDDDGAIGRDPPLWVNCEHYAWM